VKEETLAHWRAVAPKEVVYNVTTKPYIVKYENPALLK